MHRTQVEAPFLKLLVYGQPGSTKTRTVATAAWDERTDPVLMLDVSGNPQSIRMYSRKPDMVSLDALSDLNEPYDFLVNGQDPEHPFAKEFNLQPPYRTVIVDGITEVQRHSIRTVTGSVRLGPGDVPGRVDRQHYGAVLGQMINFADLFFSLEMNVVMTALEWARQDNTGITSFVPLLWGQAVDQVPAYALMVGRMVHRNKIDNILKAQDDNLMKDETVSVMMITPGGRYYAKDQYLTGYDYFINPTIKTILDCIQEAGKQPNPNTLQGEPDAQD